MFKRRLLTYFIASICIFVLYALVTRLFYPGDKYFDAVYSGANNWLFFVAGLALPELSGRLSAPAVTTEKIAQGPTEPIDLGETGIFLRTMGCVTVLYLLLHALLSGFDSHLNQLATDHPEFQNDGLLEGLQFDFVGTAVSCLSITALVYCFHLGTLSRHVSLRSIVGGVLLADGLYVSFYLLVGSASHLQLEQHSSPYADPLLPGASANITHVVAIATTVGIIVISLIAEALSLWFAACAGSWSARRKRRV